jgi:YjbE family integral membrane protein
MLTTSFFWVTLGQIMMINILLSGDNAVVIALASRSLPPAQQKKAILFGSFGAIVLRIVLTFFAVALLTLPFLKLLGGVLLIWIGIKMLVPEDDEGELEGHSNLMAAIRTIIVADFVMSLDNVLGVAAAAKGSTVLLILGLGISIPLIIYGSTLVLKLMERFPVIVTAGAGLLGWVAGEMMVTDPALTGWLAFSQHTVESMHTAVPAIGAALVVAVGVAITHAMKVSDDMTPKPLEDLAEQPAAAAVQPAPVSDGRAPA